MHCCSAIQAHSRQAVRHLHATSSLLLASIQCCCRALGEYATQATVPQTEAAKLVSDFLNSLTSFDVVLARAARDKKPVPEAADRELAQALENMDRYCAKPFWP